MNTRWYKVSLMVLVLAIMVYAQQPVNINNIPHVIVDTAPTTAVTQSGNFNVRTQDGAGNALTSNSSTYTAKFALDVNVLGTLGTAFSTAGKVDVKGADGDVFVRQTTASNLNVTARLQDGSGNAINSTGSALNVNFAAGNTISLVPVTSGGLTMSHTLLAATNNAASVKASAGQLYVVSGFNAATYPLFAKFYNKASAPSPASDTVVFECPMQAGVSFQCSTENGRAFSTGIAMAVVKGISDTDNTSTVASDGVIELGYK